MSNVKPLWPNNATIPVIGLTGDLGTGKTLFAATIAPKRTLYIDVEKSALTYKPLGFTHIDLVQELTDRHPKGYTGYQLFMAWYDHIKSASPHEYDVIVTDPISDIESGLVDYVKSRATAYGFKGPEQFAKSKGIFWNIVRDEYKRIIAMITGKCQTFVYTTHMKAVWKYGEMTKEREAKGKTTLREMTTLYLELSRDVKKAGGVPSAQVTRDRIANFVMREDGTVGVQAVMPERMPVATPEALRQYLLTPSDLCNPKDGETIAEESLTEEERLLLEARIAENNKVAAEMQFAAVEAARKKGILKEDAVAGKESGVNGEGNGARDVTQSSQGNGSPKEAKMEEAGKDAQTEYYDQICVLLLDAKSVGKRDAVLSSIKAAINKSNGNPKLLDDLPREQFIRFRERIDILMKGKENGTD